MGRSQNAILTALLEERPRFHGRDEAGTKDFSIQPEVLEWIAAKISDGARTLETGCGYSTVLFAAAGCAHTAISPFAQEHALIRAWCEEHGIGTARLTFIAAPSQEVVPQLDMGELDFVLVDGDHAFPAPFIDWYYTADRLREGGHLAIDDTQIPTGRILRDFLRKEAGRWSPVAELGKTSVFRRVTRSPVAKGVLWLQQPYCRVPRSWRLERAVKRLRAGRG